MSDRMSDRPKDLGGRATDSTKDSVGSWRRPLQSGYLKPSRKPPADPIAHYVRKWGAAYSYGLMPNGDGMESAEQVEAELRERMNEVLLQLLPHTGAGKVRYDSLSGIVGPDLSPRRLANGKATVLEYRQAIPYVLAHLLGIRDTLTDLERELWVLAQIAHDPRISRMAQDAALGNDYTPDGRRAGVNRRVRNHRMRKKLLAGAKPKLETVVYMPTRLVAIERKPNKDRTNE